MRRRLTFILDEHRRPVPCDDGEAFALWCFGDGGEDRRRVAEDQFADGSRLSTVFLGLNLEPYDRDPPLVFETAHISDSGVDIVGRCSTWAEAEDMHREAKRRIGDKEKTE